MDDFFDLPEPTATPRIPVHLHGVLAVQGGAARIVGLLAQGMPKYGFSPQLSCELKDIEDPAVQELSPLDLAAHVPQQHLSHMHGTRSWPDLLRGFSVLGERVNFITLHDASLLTGGCIHPVDCPGWMEGCSGCPGRFPDAARRQSAVRYELKLQAPVLISPSAWLRKMARTALPELHCELIPNGVEDPLVTTDREAARRSFGLKPRSRMLLFAAHGGELTKAKGGQDFLRIWQLVKDTVPGAVAFIVGGDRVARDGDIYYWPYVDNSNMHRFMLAADVLVNTSAVENHPLVVLEAMAANVPVCAYKTGGIPEQVVDRETGFLAPPGNIAALAEATASLLGNSLKAKEFGLEARLRYERYFKAERMVEAYAKLYRSALNE